MKAIPVIFIAWLAVSCPSWAENNEDRFVEFKGDNSTTTYDLTTVQMIQPGRFTVISTTIDNPDVMKFELMVFGALRAYCARPDGKYPAPASLFTLGSPDMPVESIDVENNKEYKTRTVGWSYPYKRLAINTQGGLVERPFLGLRCESPMVNASDAEKQKLEIRSLITNGNPSKYLLDCRRGMMSAPLFGDDPSKALMFSVQGSGFESAYISVCYKVTHESPYLP